MNQPWVAFDVGFGLATVIFLLAIGAKRLGDRWEAKHLRHRQGNTR